MANSKTLIGYTGTELAKISVPTSVNNILVRRIKADVFDGAETVLIDTYANDIPRSTEWGAQNVVWLKEPKCTISFNANEGEGTMEDLPANIGIAFVVPTCKYTKYGYVFSKWALNSTSGTQISPGDNYAFEENSTLYAIWADNWEEPVQTDNKVYATQFLTITETTNKITVE